MVTHFLLGGAGLTANRVRALWVKPPAGSRRFRRNGILEHWSMLEWFGIVVVTTVLLVILVRKSPLKRVIVYEHQKALRYRKGRYAGTLGPGQYWIITISSSIVPSDVRTQFITIQGQDVLS